MFPAESKLAERHDSQVVLIMSRLFSRLDHECNGSTIGGHGEWIRRLDVGPKLPEGVQVDRKGFPLDFGFIPNSD